MAAHHRSTVGRLPQLLHTGTTGRGTDISRSLEELYQHLSEYSTVDGSKWMGQITPTHRRCCHGDRSICISLSNMNPFKIRNNHMLVYVL